MPNGNKTSQSTAHDVLRKITLKHLKDAYGEVEIYKSGKLEYWKFNEIAVKPYFYADHLSTAFITTPSKESAESIIDENACIMGSDYYGGNPNAIVIYFFQPEIILNHYADAGINNKGTTNTWHVRVNHDNENLIFKRAGNAEDVLIPIDEHNYYLQFELTDEEAQEMQNAVHKRTHVYTPQDQLLKLLVKSNKGKKKFTKKSPMAIAVLSILKESPEITVKEMLSHMSSYDIEFGKTNPGASLRYILRELMNIEAVIRNSQNQYSINEDVQVEVIL